MYIVICVVFKISVNDKCKLVYYDCIIVYSIIVFY